MKRTMIRYKVKANQADENASYVRKVFEQLQTEQPAGLRYATFKLEDGVSFVHIVSVETADGSNPLMNVAAFKNFTAQVRDRCEEAPVAMDVEVVGAYGWFEG
jgi:hypothetical protein